LPATANGRKQVRGIGPDGKPLSSYWKAKLDAESRQERIEELGRLLGESQRNLAEVRDVLERMNSLVEQAREFKTRNKKLQNTALGLRTTNEKAKARIKELEREVDSLTTKLTRAKTSLKDARSKAKGTSGRGTQTIRGMFEWLGVELRPRVLVEGVSGRDTFRVVLREDDTLARVEMLGSEERVYYTAFLSDPARKIIDLIKPSRRISSYSSDGLVLEALKLMGAPFHIDEFG